MRARHIIYLVVIVAAAAIALAGCELFGFVSIDQRIGHFQDALNNTDRSTAYENFHPDKCNDYNSLKNPAFFFDSAFPTANISYSLSVYSESDPSAVIVSVSGNGYSGAPYLKLNMQTTGLGDNRIVSMDTSTSSGGPWTNVVN